jgi:hypothetical protein
MDSLQTLRVLYDVLSTLNHERTLLRRYTLANWSLVTYSSFISFLKITCKPCNQDKNDSFTLKTQLGRGQKSDTLYNQTRVTYTPSAVFQNTIEYLAIRRVVGIPIVVMVILIILSATAFVTTSRAARNKSICNHNLCRRYSRCLCKE